MKKGFLALLAALVLVCLLGIAAAEGTTGYGYIDKNGNVIIPGQFDYAYSFSAGRGLVFRGTLSTYGSPDVGSYGYIDETGAMVIPYIYSSANSFSANGLAVVKKGTKYGVIDVNGDTVIDFTYDYITYNASMNTYKAFMGTLTTYGSPDVGTYYMLDEKGAVIFTGNYKYIYAYQGYYEASNGSKYALLSADGTPITEFIYDSMTAETADILGFKLNDLYGYMDPQGNVKIEATYDSIGTFVNGRAIVKKNGKYMLIDEVGLVVRTFDANYVNMSLTGGATYAFEGTLSKYGSPDVGTYYLLGLDGQYHSRGFRKGDTYGLTSNGVWRVKEGSTWYVMDKDGNQIFSILADDLYTLGNDRYAAKYNGKYALVDLDGNRLTDYTWDKLSTTDSELIAVHEPYMFKSGVANNATLYAEVIARGGTWKKLDYNVTYETRAEKYLPDCINGKKTVIKASECIVFGDESGEVWVIINQEQYRVWFSAEGYMVLTSTSEGFGWTGYAVFTSEP